MTNAEMVEVVGAPSAWPDLIKAELEHRKVTRGAGALNASLTVGQPLTVTNDNCCVEITHPLRFVSVQGTVKAQSGSLGKPYFEVSIDALDPDAGSNVCIGWDLVRTSLHPAPVPGLTPGEELTGDSQSYGASLQNDGFVHSQSKSEVTGCSFGENSVVGCGLDLSTHRVLYFIDGKPLDLTVTHSSVKHIRVQSPYILVPAATMFAARSNSRCKLTFNFTGPFRHELLVKEGFWEAVADVARKKL
jgi:hypothetical protein